MRQLPLAGTATQDVSVAGALVTLFLLSGLFNFGDQRNRKPRT
jgi:hypothetical protein